MRRADFLLLGGGLASATAAETLREEGEEGSILIVSSEPLPPYHRPPLSKRFLDPKRPPRNLLVLDEPRLAELGIELLLETTALAVDPTRHIVRTDRAGEIEYGKLLIATGVAAIRMDVPGAGLAGVHVIRTLADAESLRQAAATAKRAVVVGGSFVGMETAAALTSLGIAVTIVDQERSLFSKLRFAKVSSFLHDLYDRKGVSIRLGETVTALNGKGRVREVVTSSGLAIPCDIVVVAIGVSPVTAFLDASGVAAGDGVLVDQHLQSSKPDIYAAGDVAAVYDPAVRRHVRVEHWDSAIKQGRIAARNMLGQRRIHDELSYFYCEMFDVSVVSVARPDGETQPLETIERGDLQERSYAQYLVANDRLQAMLALGRPAWEMKAAEALIRYRVNIGAMRPRLADPDFAIESIPNQTVLILQGGGAMGSFECGAVKALEEHGICPDIVAGVSIGAFNGAIIASNPGRAATALEAFWNELSVLYPDWPDSTVDEAVTSWQTLAFGLPRFFRPRWTMPIWSLEQLPYRWTSLYDTSPMRALIERYVDFAKLKDSPVRLLISAVNVETAELEVFDSYCHDLTADHILASGSLPPGFPWTAVEGRHYWDGGIVSNSPLDFVEERCGGSGKRIFIVDLYASRRALPANLMEVLARRDEIVYAERVRRNVATREMVRDYTRLVEDLLAEMDPARAEIMRQRPRYVQLVGDRAPTTIVRIVREPHDTEIPGRDFDFSQGSVRRNRELGYATALARLAQPAVVVAPEPPAPPRASPPPARKRRTKTKT